MPNNEFSAYENAPIEFYTFTSGANIHKQVAADFDMIGPGGYLFSKAQLARDGSVSSSEMSKNTLNIETTRDNVVCQYFKKGQPDDIVKLLIQQEQVVDNIAIYITIWQGRLSQVSWKTMSATIIAEPISIAIKRLGNRTKFQRLCRHNLYDHRCLVSQPTHQITANITAYNGSIITIDSKDGKPDDWFHSGKVTTELGATRMITGVSGLTLTLTHPFNTEEIGIGAYITAGCDGEISTCESRFNNRRRYGGFRTISTKNPFTDGAIDQ